MFATPTKSYAWSSSVSLTIFADQWQQQWCHKDVDVNPRDRNKHTVVTSSNGLCATHTWYTGCPHTNTYRAMHTSTLSKTQTKTCVTGCLTRCYEAEAFCSWLPISSINSLPSTHPTPLHPSPPYSHRPGLNGRHDYVATRRYGNHLLGNEPRCLQAGTTLWQLWEDKSISKIGGNLLCFSFSPFFKINLFTAFSQTRRTKKKSASWGV